MDSQNKPYLWVYEKGGNSIIKASAKDVAVEKHYFSFLNSQGQRDSETLENSLADIEGRVASIFKKIFNEESLSEDDRVIFALFLALMMTRVPNFRNNIAVALKSVTKSMASHKKGIESSIRRSEQDTDTQIDMPIEELRQCMLDGSKYEIKVNPHFFLAMAMFNLDRLFNMKWTFIKATSNYKFLSGDNPLYYCDPTHDPCSFYGVGLLNKNVQVTLPLSHEVALFASRPQKSSYVQRSSYIQGKNAHVKDINKRTILAASRFVFASERSDIINRLVQKCIGSAPKFELGVI